MEDEYPNCQEHDQSLSATGGLGEEVGDEGNQLEYSEVKEYDLPMENANINNSQPQEDQIAEVKGTENYSSDAHLYRVSRFYCQRLLLAMDGFVERLTYAPLEEALLYTQEREDFKPAAQGEGKKEPSNHLLKLLKEKDLPFSGALWDFLSRLCNVKQELQGIVKDMNEKDLSNGCGESVLRCSDSQMERISEQMEMRQTGNRQLIRNKRRLLDTMYVMSETRNAQLLQMSRIALGDCQDPGKALRLCPVDCSTLAAALTPLGIIEEVNLSHCCIGPEGLQQLSDILHHCRSLRLSWNSLGDLGVKILCSSLREPLCEIQELWVDYNDLTSVGTKELVHAIVKNQSLQLLSLSYNRVGEATMKLLCDVLRRHCCTIQYLRLCGTGLTSGYCKQLAWALSANRSLTVLDLDNNQLGDSAVSNLCRALMKPDCKIQALRLGSNRLTALCSLELTRALHTNRSLRQLSLSYNRLGLSGLRRLATALKEPTCRIQKLELDDNGLRDACAEELATAYSGNRWLKGLYLNRNCFTDHSIPAFHRLAESCRSLRYIWLWRNQFSAEGRNKLRSSEELSDQVTIFV